MRKTLTLTAVLALAFGLLPPGVAQAAFPEPPLVFHELTPCAVFDTRPSQGGTGALAGGESRTFHVVGSTSNFASQGGTAGGCGIPGYDGTTPQTEMVYLNLVAVDPAAGGNLKVWATDDSEPQGGVVNYQKLTPNLNTSNSIIVGVRQDTEGADITVKANVSSTHVRGVALGYLTQGEVSFWALEGNSGTDSSVNFVGTTDDAALNFRVNDVRAFRLEPNATSPNVIGGFSGNSVTAGAHGVTISGGGVSILPNEVTDDFGTVGGGRGNQAGDAAGPTNDARMATVAGGHNNTASGDTSMVGGGQDNTASSTFATVGGGNTNTASGDTSTVGGGQDNTASGPFATVGGGGANSASGDSATIGGGVSNMATAVNATIGGGTSNQVTNTGGTVAGGSTNTASGNLAAVGGGFQNVASGQGSFIGGGSDNVANGDRAVIGGGSDNVASVARTAVGGGNLNTASGLFATVPGGASNTAGGQWSFAAGRQAKANHQGSFVWADSQGADMASSGADQFILRAQGGFFLQSDSTLDSQGGFLNTTTGAFLSGAGVWTNASSRDLKAGFLPVDGGDILDRVASLPITTWQYRAEPGVLHIGPVAEDFHAVFGVGADDKSIGTVDADGVALAAIQGLHEVVEAQQAEITELRGASDGDAGGRVPWLPWAGALTGFALCMALAGRRRLVVTA